MLRTSDVQRKRSEKTPGPGSAATSDNTEFNTTAGCVGLGTFSKETNVLASWACGNILTHTPDHQAAVVHQFMKKYRGMRVRLICKSDFPVSR